MTTVHFYEHVQQAESRLTNCKADLTSLHKMVTDRIWEIG